MHSELHPPQKMGTHWVDIGHGMDLYWHGWKKHFLQLYKSLRVSGCIFADGRPLYTTSNKHITVDRVILNIFLDVVLALRVVLCYDITFDIICASVIFILFLTSHWLQVVSMTKQTPVLKLFSLDLECQTLMKCRPLTPRLESQILLMNAVL